MVVIVVVLRVFGTKPQTLDLKGLLGVQVNSGPWASGLCVCSERSSQYLNNR